MTHDEALEALADHPHLWRYRQLCASDDPGTREGYRALVIALATGEPLPAARRVTVTAMAAAAGLTPTPYDTTWLRGPCGGCG